jgi:hypothetical protein
MAMAIVLEKLNNVNGWVCSC